MMEHKRSPVFVEQSSTVSLTTSKRHKGATSITSKMKKEKFGERIEALQQLVSPYGKTDTASVLLEAMDYISFLQQQVKVLNSPYLETTSNTKAQKGWESSTLRDQGLCLVPISLTIELVSDNGADIWAPIKTITPHSRRLVSDETSTESHCRGQQKSRVSEDYSLLHTFIFGSNHEINEAESISNMCDPHITKMYEIAVSQDK